LVEERRQPGWSSRVYPPRYAAFAVLIAPELQGQRHRIRADRWAEARTWRPTGGRNSADSFSNDVLICDVTRQRLLEAHGYTSQGLSFIYTRARSMVVPEAPLRPDSIHTPPN